MDQPQKLNDVKFSNCMTLKSFCVLIFVTEQHQYDGGIHLVHRALFFS